MEKISSDTYKDFFEFAKIPMLLIEEDTTISLCNRAFEVLSGYTREEVEGKLSWTKIIADPVMLEKMKEYHRLRRIKPGSAPEEYESLMEDSKGNKKNIIVSIVMLPRTNRSLAFIQDITERKQIELAVQESEEKYRGVVENSLVGFYILKNGFFHYVNKRFCEMMGYSREEIINKLTPLDLTYPEDREMLAENMRKREVDGVDRIEYSFRGVRKNGDIIIFRIIGTTMIDKGMRLLSGSILDITKEKDLEEKLLQARKLESIGHLAGGIAHDFNNMLAAILGYAQIIQTKISEINGSLLKNIEMINKNLESPLISLLENGTCISDLEVLLSGMIISVKESIRILEDGIRHNSENNEMEGEIIKAANRAANLTRQLLAFARKQTLDVKTVNLNRIILDFEKMLHRTIRENIEIGLKLSQGLDPIEADIGQIEQVILNLVLNSQDAMPKGGRIIIRTENRNLDEDYANSHEGVLTGPYVMLEISDTGTGIDKESQKKMFEPFFTTKDIGKGTGLGLATVYGIVKQHMGNIWLYSEQNKGTTFHIYFPKSKQSPEEIQHMEFNPENTGKETVIVVEDQEHVRKTNSIMLQQKGYSVLDAANGREAIEIAGNFKGTIDILVSDVVMPDMNGREVYNELLKTRPNLKVLFMSGYPMEIITHNGILEEGLNFLPKPASINEFTKKVREILDKK
ncbi:MAG: PAS domain S-box protein [Spirochaetota bacterium]